MADYICRPDNFAIDIVVCDIKQTTEKILIAGDNLCHQLIASAADRWLLYNKTPFRADRNNNRVLDHLCFHKAEYFGTEIFTTIRPAQAAACDFSTAQVGGFKPW